MKMATLNWYKEYEDEADRENWDMECSACWGEIAPRNEKDAERIRASWKYCPYCGAEFVEVEG